MTLDTKIFRGVVTQVPILDRDILKNWRYYDKDLESWYNAWNQLEAEKEEEERNEKKT